jgi:hypothetical protein
MWRGHVQHVQSGRGGFFDDLRALRTFVEGVSGIAGPALQPKATHTTRSPADTRRARKVAHAQSRKKRIG